MFVLFTALTIPNTSVAAFLLTLVKIVMLLFQVGNCIDLLYINCSVNMQGGLLL